MALDPQADLFELQSDTGIASTDQEIKVASRDLINKLYALRRDLDPVQHDQFYGDISKLIETIRRRVQLDDSKMEEMVLYSIEVQGASTPTEISEDIRLPRSTVDRILKDLESRAVVYVTGKYVPGSDRPQFMYKSLRKRTPEATETIVDDTRKSSLLYQAM